MKFYGGTVTGSLTVNGTQTINGTLTAQTLVVQTITSSISRITGSTQFGSSSINTHQFTGSLLVTGSSHTILGNLGVGGTPNERLSITGATGSQGFTRWSDGAVTSAFLGITGSIAFIHANNNSLGLGASGTNNFSPSLIISGSNVGFATTNVTESIQATGTISVITNSSVSSGPLIQFAGNGRIRPANGSDRLSIDGNALYLNSYMGGNILMAGGGGNVGIGTTSPVGLLTLVSSLTTTATTSQQAYDYSRFRINTYNGSSVGLSIGNINGNGTYFQTCYNEGTTSPLFLNPFGNNVSIGRSDSPSKFNISGSTDGSTPIIDIKASGAGAFCRGVRMLNNTMTNPSSLMYAVGYADGPRNMGQFYFYFTGDGSTGNRLSMGLHSVDDVFNIFGSGNVVIGQTSDPGYKLALNGQPGANGYTAWTNYSDARLKENITDLDSTNVLSKISSLRPVTFNYNELSGYDEETRSRRISGFIAQELQEVFPEMVGTIKINDTEYYDTNTSNLQLYLVKAIQEQQSQITSLQAEIETLKNK